jgi:hypothetical protein
VRGLKNPLSVLPIGKADGREKRSAFITAKKGTCYLTVKCHRRNLHIMRIYKYTIDAEDKRDMRRLHPDVIFDWKKITQQLAVKREECRRYRSRRRTRREPVERDYEPFYAVYEPSTRTVYASGDANAGPLLDAILRFDRMAENPVSLEAPSGAKRKLELVKK